MGHRVFFRHARPDDVSRCLTEGARAEVEGFSGRTPLHLAAEYNGNAAVVEMLLAAGGDVNARDNYRGTPLHEAAESGNVAVGQALLAAGGDVNARDEYLDTPLHRAAKSSRNVAAMVEALVAAGANARIWNRAGQTAWDLRAGQ